MLFPNCAYSSLLVNDFVEALMGSAEQLTIASRRYLTLLGCRIVFNPLLRGIALLAQLARATDS